MGVLSDALRDLIKKKVDGKVEDLDVKLNKSLKLMEAGENVTEQLDELNQKLEDVEKVQEDIDAKKEQMEAIQKQLENAKTVAETTEKASTISAAVNPAGAAIAYATKFVVDKTKSEIADLKNVIDIVDPSLDSLRKFKIQSKKKINAAIEDRKKRERIRKEKLKKYSEWDIYIKQ